MVCCVYPPITELNKPRLVHCVHLNVLAPIRENEVQYSSSCSGNCKKYDTRPKSCAGYRCSWLDGHGNTEDRPDISGVLMDTTNQIENALECKELWPDSAEAEAGRDAIARVTKSTNRVGLVVSFYEAQIRKVVGSP